MAAEGFPRDADLDDVSAKLSESLKTCRAIVVDYRNLLTGESDDGTPKSEIDTPLQQSQAKRR